MDTRPPLTVLFLCTGNSARSQMAEAIVNRALSGRWRAVSAGTRPTGAVHPLALAALREIGIQHQGESKPADRFFGQAFDLVVTVCDDAAEDCPVWLGQGPKLHIGFPDPARVTGNPEQALEAFRLVRDAIRSRIVPVLASWPDPPPG